MEKVRRGWMSRGLTMVLVMNLGAVAWAGEFRDSLFDSTSVDHGYSTLSLEDAEVLGQSVPLAGVQLVWMPRPRLGLGINGKSFLRPAALENTESTKTDQKNLQLFYMGPYAEFEAFSYKMFHASVFASFGWGRAGYREEATGLSAAARAQEWRSSPLNFMEGGLSLALRVSPVVDVSAIYTLRAVHGIDLKGVESGDVSGRSLGLSLRRYF